MLQVIIKNRFLFISSMLVIWGLVFIIPRVAQHYRLEKKIEKAIENTAKLKLSAKESTYNHYEKEDLTTDYEIAGEFEQSGKCIDTLDGTEGSKVGIWDCHGEGRNQFFFLLKNSRNIRNKQLCFEGPADLESPGPILLRVCVAEKKQSWLYENESIKLFGSSLCLEKNENNIILNRCNGKSTQKWKLKTPPGM